MNVGSRATFPCSILLVVLSGACASAPTPDSSTAAPAEAASPAQPAPTRAERRAAEKAARALDEAEVEAARGQFADAEASYRRALETVPDDARALSGVVRVLIEQGEFDAAVRFDDHARGLGGEEHLRSLSERERCHLWLSAARARVDAARADAADLLGRIDETPGCTTLGEGAGPVRAALHLLDADQAGSAGDSQGEIEALRAAALADPARFDVEVRLGRALLDLGQRREAVGQLARALERHPDSSELELLMLEALGVPEPEFGEIR